MNNKEVERVTTRMNVETKMLLERALVLSGFSSLNSFITNAATQAAKKLIEQEMVITISHRDSVSIFEALERPPKHNQHFLQAAKKYKELSQDENATFKPRK